MLLLVSILSLLSTVTAASSFANSTITSKPTTTTSSDPSLATRSCLYPIDVENDDGLVGNADYFDCNRPGDPELLAGNYNPYIYATWVAPALASSCSASFESSISNWMATAPITSQTNVIPDEDYSTSTTFTFVEYDNFFTFVPVTPCCLNCTLYGGNVQVYYWPTPAPTPHVTELVNDANFTFVSPSVYVAFESLYATDLCGHVGKDIPSTTIAFAPGALSTAMAYQYNGTGPDILQLGNNFTAASFGDGPRICTNITSSFQINGVDGSTYPYDEPLPTSLSAYCNSQPESCAFDVYSITYNPCSPTLSVPSQLFTLNSGWKGCIQGIDAFFDPPYTLTQGNGLTAFSPPADPTSTPSATVTAQPVSQPGSPTVTPTPTSVADPSTSPDPSPSPSPDPSPSPNPSPSPIPSPSVDPSPSPNPAPSPSPSPSPESSPPQNPTPTQDPPSVQNPTTPPSDPSPAQNTPAQNPQPTPGNSPAANDPTTAQPNTPSNPTQITTLIPFIVGTQTITPGSAPVVISGTTFSVPTSGGAVVINGATTQFIAPAPGGSATFVLGSQTLIAGGAAITLSSSIVVSLLSGGESVVVIGPETGIGETGSVTETLAISAVFTSTEGVVQASGTGIGGVIVSIGGFATPTATSGGGNFSGITFSGEGVKMGGMLHLWITGACVTLLGILAL